MTLQHGHNKVMALQYGHVSLHQAQEIQESLAKHNPFVRLTPEEQEIANKAHAVLQRKVKQEEFEALEDALL